MKRDKILYAIQGTGNGHVSRARALYPALIEKFDVDLALVGPNSDVKLPVDPVFTGEGITLEYSGDGKIDLLKTFLVNNPRNISREIKRIPVQDYDFILNDYESISFRAARKRKVPILGVSHQAAVLHEDTPKTKRFMPIGKVIMQRYAPVKDAVGFHYRAYSDDILPPLIDGKFKGVKWQPGKEIVVYLPAFDVVRLRKVLAVLPYRFRVFHRNAEHARKADNIIWNPIDSEEFKHQLLQAKAVVCSAGFELPSECLYLGIPLVVMPIGGQYEQWCNAAALEEFGVSVLPALAQIPLRAAIVEAIDKTSDPIEIADPHQVVDRIEQWWRGVSRNK